MRSKADEGTETSGEHRVEAFGTSASRDTADGNAGVRGLHVYQSALEFYRVLVEELKRPKNHVAEQLFRAAESVVLNIGEAYPATGADRARRFRIACDEASECGAALDLLEIRGALKGDILARLRGLGDQTRAMLWVMSRK